MIAPTLLTDRLRLRGAVIEDFEPAFAMSCDERVYRFIGGKPTGRTQVWEKFLRGPGMWSLLGYGLWTVEERGGGAFVGQLGFGRFERDMQPPLPDIPEAAWVLGAAYHGKGYAREALGAALSWSDANLRTPICCIIAPENEASLRLADSMGFAEFARGMFQNAETVMLERPA